jgi:hypothetical protein
MKPLENRAGWTGGYVFENEWRSFRTRLCRDLELTTAKHAYQRCGDRHLRQRNTMTLAPVNFG